MIADSGFPVCYGEKGILEGRMVSLKPLSGDVVELTGGTAGNIIPDKAVIVLKGEGSAQIAKALPEGFEVDVYKRQSSRDFKKKEFTSSLVNTSLQPVNRAASLSRGQ